MEAEQAFTGSSSPKLSWSKSYLLMLWIGFIAISYLNFTIIPVLVLAVFTIISYVLSLPAFETKISIEISDGKLSIHDKRSVLWKVDLKDISCIEIEESKRFDLSIARKALIMQSNKDDSYYLPLDGIEFKGLTHNQLLRELIEIKDRAQQVA